MEEDDGRTADADGHEYAWQSGVISDLFENTPIPYVLHFQNSGDKKENFP